MLGLAEEPIPANLVSSRPLQQRLFHLLHNCQTLRKLAQIHTQIVINGFSQKSFLLVKVLSLYVTSGHLLSGQAVFKDLKNPSTNLWNQMIRGYGRSQSPQKSIELFNQMVATEAEPDGFTYSYLFSGCAKAGMLRVGEQVHGRVLASGYSSDVFVETNLVNFYAANGGVEYARQVFDDMGERNVVSWNSMLAAYMRCGNVDGARRIFDDMPERNVVSWTSMISGYARNGKCRQALFLFNEMRRAHVEPDRGVLVAALSACAELGNLALGRWIHSFAEKTLSGKTSQEALVPLNNALVHMYASCGAIGEAYEVFRWMVMRSTVSWTTMITAFAKQGYAREALAVFELMQSFGAKGVRPDGITFIGVLGACSHAGMVNEGRQFFQTMTQTWGIEPRIEHYGCMVDLLSRAGLLGEAKDLIEAMPMKPNDAVWGALLGGCRIHKNAEVATHVVQELIVELNPGRAAGYLLLLAHVYGTALMWKEVALVKQRMVEIGMRKPAGRSWVQINEIVHDFVAGDRTHKDSCLIYEMLGVITNEAKREGYKPDTESEGVFIS